MLSYGYDFRIFWEAARALLAGGSPYDVGGFFSPHPLALLFTPLALLPFPIAYFFWTGLKLFLLAKNLDRWSFLKSLLFFPLIFDLIQGQVDSLVFLLALSGNWLGAALSTLRPQLAIWIFPFCAYHWFKEKRYSEFAKSVGAVLMIFGSSTLIAPDWWIKWLNAPSVAWQYNQQSASLYGIARLLPLPQSITFITVMALSLVVFAWMRPSQWKDYWQWVSLFNPVANVYSLSVLANQVDWVTIVLGLVILPLSQGLHTGVLFAAIPAYLIVRERWRAKATT